MVERPLARDPAWTCYEKPFANGNVRAQPGELLSNSYVDLLVVWFGAQRPGGQSQTHTSRRNEMEITVATFCFT